MSAVLPSEYAARPLVVIPPSPSDRQCSSTGLYTDTLQCLRSVCFLTRTSEPLDLCYNLPIVVLGMLFSIDLVRSSDPRPLQRDITFFAVAGDNNMFWQRSSCKAITDFNYRPYRRICCDNYFYLFVLASANVPGESTAHWSKQRRYCKPKRSCIRAANQI